MAKTVELRQKRAGLVASMRELLDKAEAENRGLNTEEDAQYRQMDADADEIQDRYERQEALEAQERALSESTSEVLDPADDTSTDNSPSEVRTRQEQNIYKRYLQGGTHALTTEEQERALQVDSDTGGGYLVGEATSSSIIKSIDNMVALRQLATIETLPPASSLGIPSLDNDPADSDWTTEILTGSEDSTMSFGKRELIPKPLAKLLKVSRTLLRKSPNIAGLVNERLAYKFAVSEEQAFMTGSLPGEPLGIFTASADGISTGQDVSTDNTSSAITFDGLKNAKYTIKGGYLPNARWIFHRDAIKMIDKLTDDNSQYIWQTSTQAGRPDTLLGVPVISSEYAPNTFTTGLYVGMIGDFSNYMIADSLSITIQRLDELYAATNQVGFIGRLETDGMPVLEEAFARVTLA